MTDDEERALVWVGQRSQRVMVWSGVPFIVAGFAAMAPTFFLGQWLFANVKVSALLACVPPLALVLLGMKASERLQRWLMPSMVRSAAQRFDVDEKALRDLLL